MATIRVKVTYSSGQPSNGSRVQLAFKGMSRGVTGTEYTDSSGYATFNEDPGEADVIVDGSTRTSRYLSGGDVVEVRI